MPSSLWDWVAALTGLRSGGNVFLPAYWCLPAELTAPSGWVLSPSTILWTLSLVSLLAVAVFIWKRHRGFLHVACAIWGALFADTPHILWLPFVICLVRSEFILIAKFFKWDIRRHLIAWKPLIMVFVISFVAIFACNFVRLGCDYFLGYVNNALAAIRWDGGLHPIDKARMDELLNDYVKELVREADGKRWIFTDGICDAGIELNGSVRTVSLLEGTRDEKYWRNLGFVRQEDLSALERGSSSLLRAWAVDHPGELTNAVFQCGFAFLEKEASGRLVADGLVLRSPNGKTTDDALRRDASSEKVRQLADGIVRFYREGGKSEHGGRIRQARFCAMQWRVARAMRRQAAKLDRDHRTKEALAATALSEELDRLNPYAHRRDAITEIADFRAFGSLTPREGLEFSLKRANFALARRFALPIVKDEPDNPEANFAIAMSHLSLHEYAQARHYFQIALRARPNDATLLNNLAVASMMLGDLDDARAKAEAALKVKPDSEAIKDTVKKIKSAKKNK